MNIIGEADYLADDDDLKIKNPRIIVSQFTPKGELQCALVPTIHRFARTQPKTISIHRSNIIDPVLVDDDIDEEMVKNYKANVAGIMLP